MGTPFTEYPCSLGIVTGHDAGSYVIQRTDGRVIGISGQGELSAANIEADIVAATAPASRKAGLVNRLAERRYEVEIGGIDLDGVRIGTDRRDQAMISGAITFCDLQAQAIIDWKAANGWCQLGEDGLRAIALEVGRHVQACFTRERELSDAITAATTHGQLDSVAAAIEAFEL